MVGSINIAKEMHINELMTTLQDLPGRKDQ